MSAIFYMLCGALLVLVLNIFRIRYATFFAQSPQDYMGDNMVFDLRHHLNGPIVCEGVIYGPFARVSSRFVGKFDCEWTGNQGVMKEQFNYDDGSVQNREWNLTIGEKGAIKATAPDVIGQGIGVQAGSSVQLKYRIRMPDSAGGHILDIVDWMYLAPNGNIVNRSQFRKYGFQVAELLATMRPVTSNMKDVG
jgi:hypothetical protein|tara:strand:- start:47 stop:625 length:579 start_codon:yes stop_codon:yes gene_type:complete